MNQKLFEMSREPLWSRGPSSVSLTGAPGDVSDVSFVSGVLYELLTEFWPIDLSDMVMTLGGV